MYKTARDIRSFYKTKAGRLLRRLISGHIDDLWPDMRGRTIMGCGHVTPYLQSWLENADNVFAVMTAGQGIHFWPEKPDSSKGRTCLAEEEMLPVETESVDNILLLHGLEHVEDPGVYLDELWRVLKSQGRMLVIVPSRLGLWARADWTPFGHGRPYSLHQLQHDLQDHLFVIERVEKALFMPPFKSFFVLRTAFALESFGRFIFPGLAGLHIVEVSKQLYAGKLKKSKARAFAGGRKVLVPETARNMRISGSDFL